MKYKLIDHYEVGYDLVLRLEKRWWWFGTRTEVVEYRGECTVWHDANTGRRASSSMEWMLCNIWTRIKWEKKDSEACREANKSMFKQFLEGSGDESV